jgi:hypothetical protein
MRWRTANGGHDEFIALVSSSLHIPHGVGLSPGVPLCFIMRANIHKKHKKEGNMRYQSIFPSF